jgi:6-phosphogluconate dehydrogenase
MSILIILFKLIKNFFIKGESVFARCLSSLFAERHRASSILNGPTETKYKGDKNQFVESIRKVNI